MLPGIKTVHFVYAFGFEILCFPCNSVLLWDALEFMLQREKEDVIYQSSDGFAESVYDLRLVETCSS